MIEQERPEREIRAQFTAETIRVYQAYNDAIADAALSAQRFVPPFKVTRMTWIKPSFLWMMYRAGWGYKDDGQRRILAIDVTRAGFDWALANSCGSRAPAGMNSQDWAAMKARTPVRIQWDPERDLRLQPLNFRAIQIGVGGEAVRLYIESWTRRITDVTPLAHEIHALVQEHRLEEARALLPDERTYEPGTRLPLN